MKLTGTCTLVVSGVSERSLIEFDISEQTIAVWMSPTAGSVLEDFFADRKNLWSKRISVTNIEVFSPAAMFSCKRLPPVILSSYRSSGFSIDDGEINKIMALGEGHVYATRIKLTPRRCRLTLTVLPFADSVDLQHEAIFTNHSRHWNDRFSVAIGQRSLKVRYSPRHIFVSGRLRAADIEVLQHACSLIALGPEQLIAQLKPPKVMLNYSWTKREAYGEAVVGTKDLPSSIQRIVAYLVDCDVDTRQRRFHEITHIVEGFRQKIFVEHRLTNLLKALESFDGTRTLLANRLVELLRIQKGDARFVCGIRNCLMHEGMPLAEAARKTHAGLIAQSARMERFAHLPKTPKLPWRLYVTFSRMIVSAYFRQIGISGTNPLFSKHRGF